MRQGSGRVPSTSWHSDVSIPGPRVVQLGAAAADSKHRTTSGASHTVKASMNAAATAAPWRPFSKVECAPGCAPATSICRQYDGGIAVRGLCVTLEVFSA